MAGPRLALRNDIQRAGWIALAVAPLIWLTIAASTRAPYTPWWGALLISIVFLWSTLCVYWAFTIGIVVTPNGLELRTPLVQRVVPWHQVGTWELRTRYPFIAVMTKPDGRVVRARVIAGRPGTAPGRAAQRTIDQLNLIAQMSRGPAPG